MREYEGTYFLYSVVPTPKDHSISEKHLTNAEETPDTIPEDPGFLEQPLGRNAFSIFERVVAGSV